MTWIKGLLMADFVDLVGWKGAMTVCSELFRAAG
jgi:hypothetical protein